MIELTQTEFTDLKAGSQLDRGSIYLVAGKFYSSLGDEIIAGSAAVAASFTPYAIFYAQPNEASIRYQIALAKTAGGGRIVIPPGKDGSGAWSEIAVTSPLLEIYPGISYEMDKPVTRPNTSAPDLGWDFVGGTVFVGDGTFDLAYDGAVYQAAPPDTVSGWTSGCTLINLAGRNFRSLLRSGAFPLVKGLFSCEIYGMRAKDMTDRAWSITNYQHAIVRDAHDIGCKHGPAFFGNGGNSSIQDIYSLAPNADRLSKGIAWDGDKVTDWQNMVSINHVQRNAFNRTELISSCTFTSGSTAVRHPNGELLGLNLPMRLETAVGDANAETFWYIRSITFVSGTSGPADITLAVDKYRTTGVKTWSANATANLTTCGYPHIEIIHGQTGNLSSPGGQNYFGQSNSGFVMTGIDVEGLATIGVDIQYSNVDLNISSRSFSLESKYPTVKGIAWTGSYSGAQISACLDGSSAVSAVGDPIITKYFPSTANVKLPMTGLQTTSTGDKAYYGSRNATNVTPHMQFPFASGKCPAVFTRGGFQAVTYQTYANLVGLGYVPNLGDNHIQSVSPAVFTAGIAGNTMTVSAVASGALAVGHLICVPDAGGKLVTRSVTAFGTGTGGTGTYTLSASSAPDVAGGTSLHSAILWDTHLPPEDETMKHCQIGYINDSGYNFVLQTQAGMQPLSRVTGRTQYILKPGEWARLKYCYAAGASAGSRGYFSVESNGTPNV